MPMNPIQTAHKAGQSIWFDNIERRMLLNGDLEQLIRAGEIWGVTSNPSIFEHAIVSSHDYDDALATMAIAGWNSREIFWQLAIEDIQAAADLFLPVFETTKALDGYVSLEVDPTLAGDSEKTVREARNLWQKVDRPNLMIKIPATREGLNAIQKAIASGINVNVTLIFSLERYQEVIEAYYSGLEDRLRNGKTIGNIRSVASFFVSRMDSKVDKFLAEIAARKTVNGIEGLYGKAAIANTKQAYQLFLSSIHSDRYKRLEAQGAHFQRPLWASTSTKNPKYRDVMYIEQLIGVDTVNTVPPQTLKAFRDHGSVQSTLQNEVAETKRVFSTLESHGISIARVTSELEEEGVKSFVEAYKKILAIVADRRSSVLNSLGRFGNGIAPRVQKLKMINAMAQLINGKAKHWTSEKAGQLEFIKRLGWINAPLLSEKKVKEIIDFASGQYKQGIRNVLLLGMGGSSLAPEVFFNVAQKDVQLRNSPRMKLKVLDSTDPGQVMEAQRFAQLEKTLFIVSSKSGTTSEVNAFLEYFWDRAVKKLGKNTGKHFIAITDPGTPLEELARKRQFAKVFIADPNVGGRYSALTVFGLVPAALIGVDIQKILKNALAMRVQCMPGVPAERNPGLVLGGIMGNAALCGKNKLTLIADEPVSKFGSWLEQLIAESTGKQGRGILPIDREPRVKPATYGDDRLFIYLRTKGENDTFVKDLSQCGIPVVILPMAGVFSLGGEMYRWELATAIACLIMKINPFDQPDVQLSKTITDAKIRKYLEGKGQEEYSDTVRCNGIGFGGNLLDQKRDGMVCGKLTELIKKRSAKGTFIAINAYVSRDEENEHILQTFRKKLLSETGCATTLGFGPRFQHSTGQFHKGGPNQGLFIQIIHSAPKDLPIPGQGISFMTLEKAQAQGDYEALVQKGRKVIRVQLGNLPMEKILRS